LECNFGYDVSVSVPLTANDLVGLATDLIRLEIVLWERIDARLRERHDLPLSYFESLHFIAGAPSGTLRVGDLAKALQVTVGGTSKLADRIEAAGLIARQTDPEDRRAARVALTPQGKRKLTAATKTYRQEVAALLDRALTTDEQQQMHQFARRLLHAAAADDTVGSR
jgi:DNA-binding MarR family transcriptional regulator